MTDKELMQAEVARVQAMLADAISDIDTHGGDIRFFTAAILTAAVQICVEINGIEGLERALAKIGQREMIRAGEAGRC